MKTILKLLTLPGLIAFSFFNLYPYLVDIVGFIFGVDNIPYFFLNLYNLCLTISTHPFMHMVIISFEPWQWILINASILFGALYILFKFKLGIEFKRVV